MHGDGTHAVSPRSSKNHLHTQVNKLLANHGTASDNMMSWGSMADNDCSRAVAHSVALRTASSRKVGCSVALGPKLGPTAGVQLGISANSNSLMRGSGLRASKSGKDRHLTQLGLRELLMVTTQHN